MGVWWHTPLIPGLWRQKQEDLCKFKASLVYTVELQDNQSQRDLVTKNQTVQWLTALADLAEDTGSILSTHMTGYNCLTVLIQFQGI